MIVTQEFYVYAVKDSHGHTWVGVVNEASDAIQVYGMTNTDLDPLHFESDAYHIPGWCIANGLKCVVTKRTIGVEFPD